MKREREKREREEAKDEREREWESVKAVLWFCPTPPAALGHVSLTCDFPAPPTAGVRHGSSVEFTAMATGTGSTPNHRPPGRHDQSI